MVIIVANIHVYLYIPVYLIGCSQHWSITAQQGIICVIRPSQYFVDTMYHSTANTQIILFLLCSVWWIILEVFSHLKKKKKLLCGNGKWQLSRGCAHWKILHKYCIFRVLYKFFHIAVSLYAKWLNTDSTSYGSVVAAAPLSTSSTCRLCHLRHGSALLSGLHRKSIQWSAQLQSWGHKVLHQGQKSELLQLHSNCIGCVDLNFCQLKIDFAEQELKKIDFELANKLLMCKIFCS